MIKPIYLFAVVIMVTFVSCKDQLDCNSEVAKSTLKNIWKGVESRNEIAYTFYGINNIQADSFIDNYIEINDVKTLLKDKDLKTCKCEASLTFNVPKSITKISSLENESDLIDSLENEIIVAYNLQGTSNGGIYAETYPIEELSNRIAYYTSLIQKQKRIETMELVFNPDNKAKDKLYRYISSNEDCAYEISFEISDNNVVKGEYLQKCTGSLNYTPEQFKGYIKNGVIYGNVDNKESFELEFNGDKMAYYLREIKTKEGDAIGYERSDPLVYDVRT